MLILSLISLVVGTPANPEIIAANSTMDFPENEAVCLINRGFAKPCKADVIDKGELVDAVIDAMAELPAQAFGKDGKPSVKSIEKVLGQNITAEIRDMAWEAYQSLIDNASTA